MIAVLHTHNCKPTFAHTLFKYFSVFYGFCFWYNCLKDLSYPTMVTQLCFLPIHIVF